MDPNAAMTVAGTGEGAEVTYICLNGYLDSAPGTTYKRTCTGGSWGAGDPGDTCTGQYYILLVIMWIEYLNSILRLDRLSQRT